MPMEEDLLDIFLSTAAEEVDKPARNNQKLKEIDIFGDTTEDLDSEIQHEKNKKSVLHTEDTDSSDDEDNRNPENRKYSDDGKKIKILLNDVQSHTKPKNGFYGPRERVSWKKTKSPTTLESPKLVTPFSKTMQEKKFDVFIDPVFGLRIVNPLISSVVLKERMIGRDPVQFNQLSRYIQMGKSNNDWVLAGVIANKSAVRTSQKGNQFLIWTLTDLKDDIKTVSLFLFGSAYQQLWKTQVGLVIGILNPNVLDKKDGSKDIVSSSLICKTYFCDQVYLIISGQLKC